MTLGEKLWRLREKNRLPQEALAEKLGVSRQTISNWENDRATPDALKLKELCKALSVNADDLLSDETERLFPKEEQDPQKVNGRGEQYSKDPPRGNGKKNANDPIQRAVCFGILTLFSVLLLIGGIVGLYTVQKRGESPAVSSAFAFNETFLYGALIAAALIAFAIALALFLRRKK